MSKRRYKGRFEKSGSGKCSGKVKRNICLITLSLVLILGITGMIYIKKQITDLRARASSMKSEMKSVALCLANGDPNAAEEALHGINRDADEVRHILDGHFWQIVSRIPFVRSEFTSVNVLLDSVDTASEDLALPVINLMRAVPLESLKQETGWNTDGIIRYLVLAQDLVPRANDLIGQLDSLELGLLDRDGRLGSVIQSAATLTKLTDDASSKLLQPIIWQLSAVPPEKIWKEDKFDLNAVCSYLEFAQATIPQLGQVLSQADSTVLGQNEALAAFLDSTAALVDILENSSDTLIGSLVNQLRDHPLDDLTVDGGFDVATSRSYLNFVRMFVPELEQVLVQIRDLDPVILQNEKISSFFEKVWNVTVLYHQNEEIISFAEAFLGDGEDRLYLLAAQNSAEIRASGGFPGAMGTIRIRNGQLVVEDFAGVNSLLAVYAATPVSKIEHTLFLGSIGVCRDADFCPDFERVAGIWSLGYETKNKESIDGVISLTPAVIQKLLGVVGDVTLSDGTVLTGENATKVLQRDIYFKYFGNDSNVTASNAIVDALFAETAKKSMQMVTSNISLSRLVRYLDILHEGCADRTIMAWMKNETEQEIVRRLGWSGGLNCDPSSPAAGVYFNCTVASKMGWFLNMDIAVGEAEVNEDGSKTYPMKVTLENTMTPEELAAGNYYIDGGRNYLGGALYLFAPAGGSVGDFSVSTGLPVSLREYHELQLGHVPNIELYYKKPLVITYRLTTAPGVDTPLAVSQTPTLQAYR